MSSYLDQTRLLPHNLDSEKAILGAILLYQPALFEACEYLNPDDFYVEAHRIIFDAFLTLQKADTSIDLVTLKTELQRTGKLESCGGPSYVFGLTDGMVGMIAIKHYAAIVRDASIKRKIIQLGGETMARAYQGEEQVSAIIDELQLSLLKLSQNSKKQAIWQKAPDLVDRAYKEIESLARRKTETVGLDTGFKSLNRLTQGLHPGELVILAGRPGHGKSSIATNIITHGIIKHGWRVGLFTMEMSALEVIKRALYSESQVDSYRAGAGYLTRDDWNRLQESASVLSETRLSVDESGGLNISQLRSRAQQLAIDGGLDLLVVDYLQLMSGSGRRNDNRVNELTEITRGMKTLAKDLGIPIIALSQLNRSIENDKDRKPVLADLRESGSIEQDADTVLFIWREELRSRKPEDAGKAELIIGKQRNGPTGNIVLSFLPKLTKFFDSTTQQEFPEYA